MTLVIEVIPRRRRFSVIFAVDGLGGRAADNRKHDKPLNLGICL